MNTQSLEQQLQQLDPPAPDPESRLRARRAAVAEFERLAARKDPQSRSWVFPGPWLGGLAAACLAIVGVSIFWLMPAADRTAPRATVPASPQAGAAQPPTPVRAEAAPPPMAAAAPAKPAKDVVATGASATAGSEATRSFRNPAEQQRTRASSEPPPPATVLIVETATMPAPPAPPVPAAEGDELSEVTVTGSRQISSGTTAANPLAATSKEEMSRLGLVNASGSLAQLTPAGGAASSGAIDRNQAFIGNTIANLRGVDPTLRERTLTLVDGRRVMSPADQAVAGGDKFAHFEINPVKRTADEPISTFSADVDTASYSFVRRQLNSGVLPPADAVRTEEMINYFDYAWPAASSREQPFKPTVTVSDSPWGKGRKLLHIGIKGYELPARQRPDVNLVLLLDVSGSMNSPDRLPLAQRSMALLLDSLKPTDTVGIAVYAGRAGEVLPPTPVSEKDTILQALFSLRPGGSTAGAAGIQLAYEMAARNFRKGGVNRILLATDGDFNVGIRDTNELKSFVQRQRDNGVFLSVLGFGQGNYRDEMAQTLAQNGNGVAAYIDTLGEARKVLVREAGAQLFTIAKDVKLQVEFNPATVAEYRLVGYETRALNREDFNNDKVDAGDIGAGHTVTAIYEITPTGSDAQLMDERRYGADEKPAAARGKASEYGYLKIRYKLPDSSESLLLEQPIAVKTGVPSALRRDVQFSTAVAGFAQLLQGGRYTGSLDYDEVFQQAQDALGKDPNGYRAEFLQLVRRAQGTLRPSNE